MSEPLRSGGWSVRPSFVPHGPTSPVTLLADDRGLTQLAGIPDVAWQTPWSELSSLQLARFSRGMALFATAAGVRYCWRTKRLDDFEAWREVVLEHGGEVTRRQRRAGVFAVIAVVLLASFAGGIAAFFSKGSSNGHELSAARAVNVTLKDLPAGWTTTTSSALGYLFPPSNQVVTSTTTPASTTTTSATSVWSRVSAQFQTCMGVTAKRDRVYGAAGQMPDYQVSSRVLSATSNFLQVASITQYYATTTMVKRDVAEMSKKDFGACFAASNASLILSGNSGAATIGSPGTNWQPQTFTRGWSRGGVVTLTQLGATVPVHLVMVEAAAGHFEVTLGALVTSWPQSESFLANLVNTLLSRITSTTSTAV